MGELPHEKIYQVEFPERPGALRQFLSVLQPEWNITLFHYRRSGMQAGTETNVHSSTVRADHSCQQDFGHASSVLQAL